MLIYRHCIGVRKIIVIRMCMLLILIVTVGVNVCGYMYPLDAAYSMKPVQLILAVIHHQYW